MSIIISKSLWIYIALFQKNNYFALGTLVNIEDCLQIEDEAMLLGCRIF